MKIVEINCVNVGSTGKIMLQIAENARAAGHTVYTCCPRRRMNMGKAVKDQLWIGGFLSRQLHLRLGWFTGLNGCFSWLATRRFLRKLDRIRPDLIQLHNLHNGYIHLGLLFRYIKERQIPCVWTLHDCWAFTGQCPHFQLSGCGRWRNGCGHCTQIHAYPAARIDQTARMWENKRAWFTGVERMTLVTPSRWLADLTKQSFLRDYPIEVIHNGIDLTVFQPAKSDLRRRYGISEDEYVVLGVAFDWGHGKGLDVFVDLAQKLPEKYRIVLVGVNEADEKTLPERIVSVRRTRDQHELAQLYTMADVFANPTREEVLGLVNIEALACGTPVVTFRTGGCVEVADETCGCVTGENTADAMRREIIRICEEKPYQAEDCVKRARSFDKEKKTGEYIRLYEKLMQDRGL